MIPDENTPELDRNGSPVFPPELLRINRMVNASQARLDQLGEQLKGAMGAVKLIGALGPEKAALVLGQKQVNDLGQLLANHVFATWACGEWRDGFTEVKEANDALGAAMKRQREERERGADEGEGEEWKKGGGHKE